MTHRDACSPRENATRALSAIQDACQVTEMVVSVTVAPLVAAFKATPANQQALIVTLRTLQESMLRLNTAQKTLALAAQLLAGSTGLVPEGKEPVSTMQLSEVDSQGGEISFACSPRGSAGNITLVPHDPSASTPSGHQQTANAQDHQSEEEEEEEEVEEENELAGVQYQLMVPVTRRHAPLTASPAVATPAATAATMPRPRGLVAAATAPVRLAARGAAAVVCAPLRVAMFVGRRLTGRAVQHPTGAKRSMRLQVGDNTASISGLSPRPSYLSQYDSFRHDDGRDDVSVVWPEEEEEDSEADLSLHSSGEQVLEGTATITAYAK